MFSWIALGIITRFARGSYRSRRSMFSWCSWITRFSFMRIDSRTLRTMIFVSIKTIFTRLSVKARFSWFTGVSWMPLFSRFSWIARLSTFTIFALSYISVRMIVFSYYVTYFWTRISWIPHSTISILKSIKNNNQTSYNI